MHTQVMGNSVEQWYKTYDLHFNKRQAQQAIDLMKSWRAGQLARARLLV